MEKQREERDIQREKGEATRRRRWEQRQERKRLAAQKQEEENRQRRRMDEAFMKAALGDVPIGCVIVSQGKIIARGYNRRNADKSVLSHAELIAIRKACRKMNDWRLEDCTIYITLEPCPMCAGAIVQARIPRVVIGSRNPKAGCAGSVLDLLHEKGFNHQADLEGGVLEADCTNMLQAFFRELRQEKNADIGKA